MSWETFIKTLRDTGLKALAEQIQHACGKLMPPETTETHKNVLIKYKPSAGSAYAEITPFCSIVIDRCA